MDNNDSRQPQSCLPTAKNASFVKKQPIYANSPYELTKQVGAVADWTVVEITDRQKRLAQIAVTTWAL